MAGDGDGVGAVSTTAGLDEAYCLGRSTADTAWTIDLIGNDTGALDINIVVVVVMVVMVEWVPDAVGSTFDAAAEGVIVAVVVVVAHVSFVLSVDFDIGFDSYVCNRAATFVLDVVRGVGAAAVVSLSNIELVLNDTVVVLAAVVLDVDGISDASAVNFDVDFGVFVFSGPLVSGIEVSSSK